MKIKGIMLRINRSIQVEGAFGILKEDHGFMRFLNRGNNMERGHSKLGYFVSSFIGIL